LRIGVGPLSSTSPTSGLRQFIQNVSVEGLGRLSDDGHVEPFLTEGWNLTNGGRSLTLTVKPGAKFHDGSPVDARALVAALGESFRESVGPLAEQIERVHATDERSVQIDFKRPSPLLLESLEVQIRKPGQPTIATGPFMVMPDSPTELQGNANYHRGTPNISKIRIQTFPSLRTAWAELLRDRLDMLYEVGADALDSLESSTNVAVFTYVRHYQYLMVLNADSPALRSATVRRALNMAIDRGVFVREALGGHGVPSTGLIWPKHWALPKSQAILQYDPVEAARLLAGKNLRLTCLVPSESGFDRLALALKRQLASVGVDIDFRAASQDEIYAAEDKRTFEAILIERISGPTVLRTYQVWDSHSPMNAGNLGNKTVDSAFDRVRDAETEEEYRQAVGALQQAFLDDPPAVFLAWSERARAISKRFDVAPPEPGREVLSTLRLWKPRNDNRLANRN
jgi:peptide/nickel transport system substrate-binding protein